MAFGRPFPERRSNFFSSRPSLRSASPCGAYIFTTAVLFSSHRVSVRFALASKESRKVVAQSLRSLDFSYLSYHSITTPVIPVSNAHLSFPASIKAKENEERRDWGQSRVLGFISLSSGMVNLRKLNIRGCGTPKQTSVFISNLRPLQLQSLDLSRCYWVDDRVLQSLLVGSELATSLIQLRLGEVCFSDQNFMSTIAKSCPNLESLHADNRAGSNGASNNHLSAELEAIHELATRCTKLSSLGISCRQRSFPTHEPPCPIVP